MAINLFKQPEKFSDTSNLRSPATPAERAREAMDRRIGDVVVQSYNWRRIALGLLVACIVLSIGFTVQSLKSRVVPYVVTVDKSTGEVEKAGAFVSQDYPPQEAETRYFIGQFIQNARNIQLDPVQQEKMQKKAFAFLTQAAGQKYAAIQQNEHFAERYANYTVQTKISSIEKIPDTDSYHVSWTEEEFQIATGKQETKNYQAVFSVTVIPPKDDKTLLINPLGLYISDLNFSAEIGSKAAKNQQQSQSAAPAAEPQTASQTAHGNP